TAPRRLGGEPAGPGSGAGALGAAISGARGTWAHVAGGSGRWAYTISSVSLSSPSLLHAAISTRPFPPIQRSGAGSAASSWLFITRSGRAPSRPSAPAYSNVGNRGLSPPFAGSPPY